MAGSQDGYFSPDDLLSWLKKYHDEALASADSALVDSAEPDAAAIERLVQLFEQRSPAIREAAIRRLSSYPQAARPAVVKAFREGNLSARLAALEILQQWKAPVEEMDPWHPETMTDVRFQRLDKWLNEDLKQDQIAAPKELSEAERSAARQDIARMLKADEAESAAICHRLARLGPALLPDVYALLKDVSEDQDRQRLLVLRYRLVAADSLVLRWPGGLVRLAGSDPRQRQKAAEELVNLASAPDQPLLTELFSDPDPLVREISLRGLQHIGGKEANAALVKLLSDPELNVRTAVLKQLEEAPDADMLPAIVKYLKTETDPDLVVHGIRFLQESKQPEALRCLISLLSHESWQVRSEAASGIGKLMENNIYSRAPELSNDDPKAKLQADAYMALIDLLDDSDGFVVAKAVEGLANANMAVAVDPLVKSAQKHPQLAPDIFSMLINNPNMRQPAVPHIRKFCNHAEADIRAAAIGALCQAGEYDVGDEVMAALGDNESKVRIAAASAMFKLLEQQRAGAWQQMHQGDIRNNTPDFVTLSTPPPTFSEAFLSSAMRLIIGGPVNVRSQLAKPAPPPEIQTPPPKPAVADGDSTLKIEIVNPGQNDASSGADKKVEGKEEEPKTTGEGPNPWDLWLEKFYAGRQRPKWMSDTIEPLVKMLEATDPKERISAAVTLVPLGKADEALPVIEAALRSNPEYMEIAQEVLPWLTWQRRLELFRRLDASVENGNASVELIRSMAKAADHRTAELFWELLAGDKFDARQSISPRGRTEGGLSGEPLLFAFEYFRVRSPGTDS